MLFKNLPGKLVRLGLEAGAKAFEGYNSNNLIIN